MMYQSSVGTIYNAKKSTVPGAYPQRFGPCFGPKQFMLYPLPHRNTVHFTCTRRIGPLPPSTPTSYGPNPPYGLDTLSPWLIASTMKYSSAHAPRSFVPLMRHPRFFRLFILASPLCPKIEIAAQ